MDHNLKFEDEILSAYSDQTYGFRSPTANAIKKYREMTGASLKDAIKETKNILVKRGIIDG